jgi:hypothetical protein
LFFLFVSDFDFVCVLPRVWNSQFSFQGYDLFSFFFDIDSLPTNLNWISHECFVRSRNDPWHAVLLQIGGNNITANQLNRDLGLLNMQFTDRIVYLRSAGWPEEAETQIENWQVLLSTLPSVKGSLIVNYQDYTTPIPINSNVTSFMIKNLEPSHYLTDKIKSFRARYQRYIGFQWRTEVLDMEHVNFLECAKCALAYLEQASDLLGTRLVYYSSDTELDGTTLSNSISGTVSHELLNAISGIHRAFDVITWRNISMPRSPEVDLAAYGMLDRAMLAGSSILLTGKAGNCARGGAFVNQVIKWRSALKIHLNLSLSDDNSWDCP